MTPVADFERAFARHVGAEHAIALCNGTATLHTALAALGVGPERRVVVPPLTMSSPALAVKHAGGIPVYWDVDPDLWTMQQPPADSIAIPVALYGLNLRLDWPDVTVVMDAAQTLMHHNARYAFTSYSFQASKILATGEGGMLVTNHTDFAKEARQFSSLGYAMDADQPRIDKATIKRHDVMRHYRIGYNYRMAPVVADLGLEQLSHIEELLVSRTAAAALYREQTRRTHIFSEQYVPAGWWHDYWTYAVTLPTESEATALCDTIVKHGGERPYRAWALSCDEPALVDVSRETAVPVARDLQPRLVQFQTNSLPSAQKNALALSYALDEVCSE